MLHDVAHKRWIMRLWCGVVVVVVVVVVVAVVKVVDVVRCCWISCWVHAYSYKLGAHALLNVNHSYHVDLRAYALHVELRAYALHVELRADALHVELRAYALTRWLVPHAYCIVKL